MFSRFLPNLTYMWKVVGFWYTCFHIDSESVQAIAIACIYFQHDIENLSVDLSEAIRVSEFWNFWNTLDPAHTITRSGPSWGMVAARPLPTTAPCSRHSTDPNSAGPWIVENIKPNSNISNRMSNMSLYHLTKINNFYLVRMSNSFSNSDGDFLWHSTGEDGLPYFFTLDDFLGSKAYTSSPCTSLC